ncbi:MAG: Carboxynorspermidine decarboxylase, putative (EC [uncultured Sulfurovum sp.]|uniref:Carboxynorspermidine/carboxyspermidine decarboxylase n=1 Tax=uncultured Sulfurovum sp. TaxID=269237 RepID=A0A6S6TJF0_9BACT|nr:MAG: Carboxynorspermidine decarboxylase, putative (EC [uncultured Sulfurovum sp.]
MQTPYWLLEEQLLENNLKTLAHIKEQTGVKILLALKGYALWKSFPLVSKYLDGCCASGLHEAKLSDETFQKETHTYSPAFKEEDIEKIAKISHHLVFNSPSQFQRFSALAKKHNPNISLGLRVNPEYSESPVELYNPCGVYSRLGTTLDNFDRLLISEIGKEIDGFHFHALCEQDSSALENVLKAFEEKFGAYLKELKWVNFGGGHHITRKGYDIEKLIKLLNNFKDRYPHLEVYLEPGEAVGWETGTLVTSVLDIVHNKMDIAILDTSAEAQMPDTIIMPYRADVRGSGKAGEKKHTYRLAGNTCLAGDIMGDYSFDKPLAIGDQVIFEDQMHYTMVKASTFNGVPLPSIVIKRLDGAMEVVRKFDYEDFRDRLS